MALPTRGTAAERFAAQVERQVDGCWLWIGSDVNSEGYARFKVNYRRVLVHRWSFEHHVRALCPGEVVDHLCNTPRCVNPDHLRGTSQRSNVLRSEVAPAAVNARKSECHAGHAFDEANTYRQAGRRNCRRCHADREALRRARGAVSSR